MIVKELCPPPDGVVLCWIEVNGDGVLSLINRVRPFREPVGCSRAIEVRFGESPKQSKPVRAYSIRWNDVVGERLPGHRIFDLYGSGEELVGSQQFAEITIAHLESRHSKGLGRGAATAHPLLSPQPEDLVAPFVVVGEWKHDWAAEAVAELVVAERLGPAMRVRIEVVARPVSRIRTLASPAIRIER